MPEHVPAADRTHGGPGSSHEDQGSTDTSRTRRGERTGDLPPAGDGRQHGDAHGHHAHGDETEKANFKSEHGGKP